ncbi:MAG: protein translocase subunit SecF, partial [Chloroflexota bacterium]|nr:protein translocase subunit SecF [Chloroflexota bacterium]
MFNLVGKRYLFLIISLIIIVPGTISLLFQGLNLGIDFVAGATIDFRPSKSITPNEMRDALKSLNLKDLTIIPGNNTSLKSTDVVWIQLNTQVDGNVLTDINNKLAAKYGNGVNPKFNNLTVGGKKVTIVTISNFPGGNPSIGDIKTALGNLPKTTDVTNTTVPVTPGTTATTGKGTPTATATAKTTATPTVTPGKGTPRVTPTATTTPTSNPAATIPVTVDNVQQGSTTDILSLRTSETIKPAQLETIQETLLNNAGIYTYVLSNASVDSSVATETTSKAFLAVLAASAFILAYIWFSFRHVANPWRYGASAIIALLHDVLVVLGIFSLLRIQVDVLFITALLTVVGFSVHDTIVVFDRVRENLQRRTAETFDQVVNASLVQTMARSLNTSLTVLFTL